MLYSILAVSINNNCPLLELHLLSPLKIMFVMNNHFNSSASANNSGWCIVFLGERQIQSNEPLNGYAPEVSICTCNPLAATNQLMVAYSTFVPPPVTTTVSAEIGAIDSCIFSICVGGCNAESPALLYITPMATHITSSNLKICRLSRMKTPP